MIKIESKNIDCCEKWCRPRINVRLKIVGSRWVMEIEIRKNR